MLSKAKILRGYQLHSRDGEIGMVKDFYFDDHHWTIRYLVADANVAFVDRQVLISPYALTAVNKEEKYIAVNLTRKQIEESPSLDSDKPVSRQFEKAYYAHYRWPVYWGGAFAWGPYDYISRDYENWEEPPPSEEKSDPHLRSTNDVSGHHVQAVDGEIGHVADFIVDDETWAIRYLVVATKNWWPGKQVLVSPRWIKRVSWDEAKVFVDLSREDIMKSPAYTAEYLPTRDYEAGLHKHYNRQTYWADEPEVKAHSR
jgi:uncharacterized protein YrrD